MLQDKSFSLINLYVLLFPLFMFFSHKSTWLITVILFAVCFVINFKRVEFSSLKSLIHYRSPWFWLGLYFIYGFLSTTYTNDPAHSFKELLTPLGLILAAYLAPLLSSSSSEPEKQIPQSWFFICFLICIILIAFETFFHGQIYLLLGRGLGPTGEFPITSYNAFITSLSVWFWLILPILWTRLNIIYSILCCVLFATFLAISESQAAVLGLAIGLSGFALIQSGVNLKKFMFWATLATLIGAPILIRLTNFIPPSVFDPIALAAPLARLEIWNKTVDYIIQAPILGQGIDAMYLMDQEFNPGAKYFEGALHAHNSVLQIWFETGLIGVVLTAGWFITAWKYLDRFSSIMQNRIALIWGVIFAISLVHPNNWQSTWLVIFTLPWFAIHQKDTTLSQ